MELASRLLGLLVVRVLFGVLLIVLDGAEDFFGDGGRRGQVGALRLEAVLVGHVRHGVRLPVVGHEREGPGN